jgi:radical SAM protein with 4Fe4S-binding SPASM domain
MYQVRVRDALLAAQIDTVLFEATSNCNLRCTYCRVSALAYVGEDFDLSRVEMLADQMVAANVQCVQISGHGETTMLAHWQDHCRLFFERGIGVRITSNFAKIFSDDEVDVLARMQDVTISIDTIDREMLKSIRRHVDLRTILYNMQRVRLASAALDGRQPSFNWQCTPSDRVVFGLPAWVEMGLLNGVGTFTLCNLIEHKDLPEILAKTNAPLVRHVARMERDPLVAACASIRIAVARAREAGATFIIQPGILEGINNSLRIFGVDMQLEFSSVSSTPGMGRGTGAVLAVDGLAQVGVGVPAPMDTDIGALSHDIDEGQSQTVNSQPKAGQTRDCLDAWYQPYLRANGDLWPCPWFYAPLGNVHDEPFDKLMNGAAMRTLRHELLSGELRPACSNCPSRSITTPALLLKRLNETSETPEVAEGASRIGNHNPSRMRQFGFLDRATRVLARVAQRKAPKTPSTRAQARPTTPSSSRG